MQGFSEGLMFYSVQQGICQILTSPYSLPQCLQHFLGHLSDPGILSLVMRAEITRQCVISITAKQITEHSIVSSKTAPIASFPSSHTRLKPTGTTFGSSPKAAIYQRFSLKTFFTLSGITAVTSHLPVQPVLETDLFDQLKLLLCPVHILLLVLVIYFQEIEGGVIVSCFLYQSFQPGKALLILFQSLRSTFFVYIDCEV